MMSIRTFATCFNEMASASEQENNLYQCPVCLEDLANKSPRVLDCLHTLCEACLTDLLQGAEEQRKCPTCRQQLAAVEVSEFRVNFQIEQMKDRERELTKQQSSLQLIGCSFCCQNGARVNASVRCYTCQRSMCDECRETLHDNSPTRKQNCQVVCIKDMPICQRHKLEITFVCTSCLEGLCSDCLDTEFHSEHVEDILKFEEGLGMLKKKMHDLLENAISVQTSVQDAISTLDNLDKTVYSTEQSVRRNFAKLHGKVIKERHFQINRISRESEERIALNVSRLKESCKRLKGTDKVLGKLLTMKDLDFLDAIKEVKDEAYESTRSAYMTLALEYPVSTYSKPTSASCNFVGNLDIESYQLDKMQSLRKDSIKSHLNIHTKVFELNLSKFKVKYPTAMSAAGECAFLVDEQLNYVPVINRRGKEVARHYAQHESGKNLKDLVYFGNDLYLAQREAITVVPVHSLMTADILTLKPQVEYISAFSSYGSEDLIILSAKKGIAYKYHIPSNTSSEVVANLKRPQDVNVAYLTSGTLCLISEVTSHSLIKVFDEHWKTQAVIDGGFDYKFGRIGTSVLTPYNTILVCESEGDRISEFTLEGQFVSHLLTEADGLKSPRCVAYSAPFLWVLEDDKDVHKVLKLYETRKPL